MSAGSFHYAFFQARPACMPTIILRLQAAEIGNLFFAELHIRVRPSWI